MTRAHRRAHRVIWIILALALARGFVMALAPRAPAHAAMPGAIGEARQ